eukprot:SAG11_NODE_7134_length_1188_cov_5.210285_1_plen_89_part_10
MNKDAAAARALAPKRPGVALRAIQYRQPRPFHPRAPPQARSAVRSGCDAEGIEVRAAPDADAAHRRAGHLHAATGGQALSRGPSRGAAG